MKRILVLLAVLALLPALCFSQAATEKKKAEYVASTSWVAAIAELAGIDDVVCIAPANLKHPPEYEITPDDIVTVSNAKLFMNAGYERMMKTIAEAAGVDKSRIVKVKTTNTLENLGNMVSMLSDLAMTKPEASERFSAYSYMIQQAREKIKEKGYDKLKVFANTNQAELCADLGLNVVAKFGAGPLSSDQIADAARNKYDLVIDNAHNPVAGPVAEVSPSSVILVWSNFPDHVGGNALYEVIENNLNMLWNSEL